jgi:hypothetical protein
MQGQLGKNQSMHGQRFQEHSLHHREVSWLRHACIVAGTSICCFVIVSWFLKTSDTGAKRGAVYQKVCIYRCQNVKEEELPSVTGSQLGLDQSPTSTVQTPVKCNERRGQPPVAKSRLTMGTKKQLSPCLSALSQHNHGNSVHERSTSPIRPQTLPSLARNAWCICLSVCLINRKTDSERTPPRLSTGPAVAQHCMDPRHYAVC